MRELDNIKEILKLDREQVAKSISWIPKQCQQVWDDMSKFRLPGAYRQVSNIVVNGMGGSALGSHIIRSLYGDKLKLPMRIIHSYFWPAFVDSKTLCVVSSYSGSTEEVVFSVKAALKRQAKVLVITSGGALKKIQEHYKLPGYIFAPKYNPCNQPRIGLGYSIFGQWALFQKIGLIKFSNREASQVIDFSARLDSRFNINCPTAKNQAKQTALALEGKIPIVVAAEFLSGNAHALSNQINENAKNFSAYYLISELNHHLMEGLARPTSNPRNLHFLFLESGLYYSKNRARFKVTKDILTRNNIKFSSYQGAGKNKAEQVFEFLLFGCYVSFYLAMLNGFNPASIPWVDFFKEQLKKN